MNAPEYERRAWLDVQEHKRLQAERSPRALLPGSAREKIDDLWERVRGYLDTAPGYDKFAGAFGRALDGTFGLVGKIGVRSVSRRRIAGAYGRRGLEVALLEDVRHLPMQDIDRVKPSLDVAYAGATLVSGTVLGFLAGGGTMVAAGATVASGGAAAAPGMGVVVSILGRRRCRNTGRRPSWLGPCSRLLRVRLPTARGTDLRARRDERCARGHR